MILSVIGAFVVILIAWFLAIAIIDKGPVWMKYALAIAAGLLLILFVFTWVL